MNYAFVLSLVVVAGAQLSFANVSENIYFEDRKKPMTAKACSELLEKRGVWRNITVDQLVGNFDRRTNRVLKNRYVAIRKSITSAWGNTKNEPEKTGADEIVVGRIVGTASGGIFKGFWNLIIETKNGTKRSVQLSTIRSAKVLTEEYLGVSKATFYYFDVDDKLNSEAEFIQESGLAEDFYGYLDPERKISVGLESGRLTVKIGDLVYADHKDGVEITGAGGTNVIEYFVNSPAKSLKLKIRGGTVWLYENTGEDKARPKWKHLATFVDTLLSRRDGY